MIELSNKDLESGLHKAYEIYPNGDIPYRFFNHLKDRQIDRDLYFLDCGDKLIEYGLLDKWGDAGKYRISSKGISVVKDFSGSLERYLQNIKEKAEADYELQMEERRSNIRANDDQTKATKYSKRNYIIGVLSIIITIAIAILGGVKCSN
jgi:hypothetical protein